MKLNILSVIVIFVLFIPVSFADDVIGPVIDDDSVYDLDDSVYDNAAKETIKKSEIIAEFQENSFSRLNYDEQIYVFSQVVQRDSNGNLVAFFQSDKMTNISPSTIHYFLDARELTQDIQVYNFEGKLVQAYGEVFTETIARKDITASTLLVVEITDTENPSEIPPALAARFAHDGIVLEPGDVAKTYWYVARLLN